MDPNVFFSNSLPYLDAMLESLVSDDPTTDHDRRRVCVWEYWGSGHNLCIVGPGKQDVERLMPMTSETVGRIGGWNFDTTGLTAENEPRPLCIQLDSSTDINSAIELFWAWRRSDGWRASILVIAPPPELAFSKQFVFPNEDEILKQLIRTHAAGSSWLPDTSPTKKLARESAQSWSAFKRVVNEGSSASLALAQIMGYGTKTLIVLPDIELRNKPSEAVRAWAVRERAKRDDAGSLPYETQVFVSDKPYEDTFLTFQVCGPQPFVPDAAWSIEHGDGDPDNVDTSVTIAAADMHRGNVSHISLVYRRYLHSGMREEALLPHSWRALLEVASGTGDRCEDDRFLEAVYLSHYPGAFWSVSEEEPTDSPMWAAGDELGYPPRTVSDICSEVAYCRNLQKTDMHDGMLLVPLRGEFAGMCYDTWPETSIAGLLDALAHDDEDDLDLDELDTYPECQEIPEALLLSCEDPDFLKRQIRDAQTFLTSKSFGSVFSPIIPRHLIENLKVFWPEHDARLKITSAIDTTVIWAMNEGDRARDMLRRLQDDIRRLLHTVNSDVDCNVGFSPFYYQHLWSSIGSSLRAIESNLQKPAGFLWNDELRRPPLLVGYQQQAIAASNEHAEQAKLYFEMSETMLRHHAFFGLSLWRQLDHASYQSFLHKWFEGKSIWKGSMGHWEQAGTAALNVLRSAMTGESPIHLTRFADQLLAIDSKGFSKAAKVIIETRNAQMGHGFAPIGPDAMHFVARVKVLVGELDALLDYTKRHSMLLIAGRQRKPDRTKLDVQYLHGHSPILERGELWMDSKAADQAYDDCVYLKIWGNQLLPLDPWLIYRPSANGGGAIPWLFDGKKKDKLLYRSPMRPGETLLASDKTLG